MGQDFHIGYGVTHPVNHILLLILLSQHRRALESTDNLKGASVQLGKECRERETATNKWGRREQESNICIL